jgi:hypothetical protein
LILNVLWVGFITLDGTMTENVTRINIKRKPDGTLRYAYPVPETYTLRREI